MNNSLAMRRLMWKEFHQLAPLACALVLIAIFIQLLILISRTIWNNHGDSFENFAVLIGLPGLFAVGAAAVLVGQEKELRTLQWLTTLPIAPRDLMSLKFLVALIGLVVVWLASLAISATFSAAANERMPFADETTWVVFTWLGHSLFVLVVGFALAWTLNSSFGALILLIPVALIPTVISGLLNVFVGGSRLHDFLFDSPPPLLVGTQVVCTLIAFALSWLAGKHYFSARNPMPPSLALSVSDMAAREFSVPPATVSLGQPASRRSSLVWQFSRQSQGILLGLATCFALAYFAMLLSAPRALRSADFFLWALLISVAASWMGVIAFQGDRLHSRIRFLADRGVQPGLVWRTRHIVPLCVIVGLPTLILALGFLWGIAALFGEILLLRSFDRDFLHVLYGSLVVIALSATVYAISQWVSQVVASPIVAAILAPAATIAAAAYVSIAYSMLAAPIWLLVLCMAIPIIATYATMGQWMDGRLGVGYWCRHAAFLFAWMIIPAIPFCIVVATVPSMPSSVAVELHELGQKSLKKRVPEFSLTMPSAEKKVKSEQNGLEGAGVSDSAADAASTTIADTTVASAERPDANPSRKSEDDRWGQFRDHLQSQLKAHPSSALNSGDTIILSRLKAVIVASRMSLQATEPQDAKPLERYRDAMALLRAIADRLRWSDALLAQDTADELECTLLRELLNPQAKSWLGERFDPLARQLADSSARTDARKRAIAVSWHARPVGFYSNSRFGGYDIVDRQRKAGTLEQMVVSNRRLGRAVTDLWELANEGRPGATPERLAKIADYWGVARQWYGLGPAGQYLRPDNAADYAVPSMDFQRLGPASLWFAGWESQAQTLLQ